MKKVVWVIPVLLLFQCGGGKRFSPRLDPEDRFTLAKRYLEQGKYLKAQEEFKRLIFENPGSGYVDDAQFYLAEAYFLNKEYDFALLEYGYLIENYRSSEYVDDAHFKIGLSYYRRSKPVHLDQTDTKKALDEIELFLTKYPESEYTADALEAKKKCMEKLARKDLEAGKLYMKLRKYPAARVYFESVLEDYPETEGAEEVLLLIGISYEKERDFANAREAYEKAISGSTDQTIISEARARLEKLPE